MIRLVIEDYCNNCTMFEPEVVERPISIESFDGTDLIGDTIIKCNNCNTCKKLMGHLQTKFLEESARKTIGMDGFLFTNERTNEDIYEERCCSKCKGYMFSDWEEPCNHCTNYSQFY